MRVWGASSHGTDGGSGAVERDGRLGVMNGQSALLNGTIGGVTHPERLGVSPVQRPQHLSTGLQGLGQGGGPVTGAGCLKWGCWVAGAPPTVLTCRLRAPQIFQDTGWVKSKAKLAPWTATRENGRGVSVNGGKINGGLGFVPASSDLVHPEAGTGAGRGRLGPDTPFPQGLGGRMWGSVQAGAQLWVWVPDRLALQHETRAAGSTGGFPQHRHDGEATALTPPLGWGRGMRTPPMPMERG